MKKINLILVSALVCLSCLSPGRAVSQKHFWAETDGCSGGIYCIQITPGGVVYAAGSRGIFRSRDDGATWKNIFADSHISSVALSQRGYLFGGSCNNLFRSTDLGASWSIIKRGCGLQQVKVSTWGFVMAATSGGLYRSATSGRSWSKIHVPSRKRDVAVHSLAVNKDRAIYAAMDRGEIFISVNEGYTWHKITSKEILNGEYFNVWTDPAGNVFSGYCRGDSTLIFRSSNRGVTWSKIFNHKSACICAWPLINANSFASDGAGKMAVTLANDGIFLSSDYGATWGEFNMGVPPSPAYRACDLSSDSLYMPISVAISRKGYLLMGTEYGVFRSAEQFTRVHPSTEQDEVYPDTPPTTMLWQNYPNPFNPTTYIRFELEKEALVTLKIYNTLGQEISTLAEREFFSPGENELEFDGSRLPSGVYYSRIMATGTDGESLLFTGVKKMLLVK